MLSASSHITQISLERRFPERVGCFYTRRTLPTIFVAFIDAKETVGKWRSAGSVSKCIPSWIAPKGQNCQRAPM